MTIYETVMKDRNVPGADRALLSLIAGEICVDGKPMNDSDAVKRLSQMVKVCSKNIDLYKKAENFGEALKEASFSNMINEYLPKGAEESDVEDAITELNVARDMKSMGAIMKHLKSKFEVVDGNMVRSTLLDRI